MSLASPYQEQYYVADGVTTSFAFGQGFTALNEIDIKCIIYFEDGTDCIPVFNVNTVTGYINIVTLTKPDGTVLTVPPAGAIVRIFRDTPEAQNVTASQLQNYTAKQLERVFDSIVAMIQEISYSDQHKTIRLTETQRDIAIDYLPNDKDQAVIYWDMESRKLMPADFGQNQVVKSDGIEWLVYNKSEGKIYYVPRDGGSPIPIGNATIHNDLSGRNAPDCHPESAITGLTQDLQELRDKDLALDEGVQTALNRSQEAKDTADEAKDIAEYAQSQVAEAKDIAEDAKEIAEGIEDIAQEAKDIADEALDKVTQEIADRQDADTLLQNQITDNKGAIEDHIANTNNPHSVTKAQVGLGNVDNTSDLDKPISAATQSALDLKMPISTKYGASISLTIDSSTYVVTVQLKDQDNNNLGTAQTIDLPLESVVVSGSYDSDTKEVILVLENGSEIRFSVADLISGLQSEITAQNPLDADLVNDSTSAHKFVTATEKTNWNNHIASTNNPHSVTKAQVGLGNVDNTSDLNKPISTATQTALNGKQNTISDLSEIRSGAALGATASDTIATYGDIVTHNVSDFVTRNTAQTISGLKTFSADIVLSGTTSIKNTTNGVSYTMLYRDTSGIHVGTSTQALLLAGSNARPKFNNNDIAMLSDVPTAVSQLTNDTGFITNAVNNLQNYTLTSNLATVATTGDYDDLLNKPTIPTVNDATLTIQKNGTSVATFTANASSNVTANISVPTTTNDLTNNSGFITSSDIPVTDVTVGGTSVVSSGVAAVPAIPTVNNATITITQGGVTKGSFTLNQATGDTIALDAGSGSDSSYHPDLFDVKWADHILNDVQWLRADTYSWQSGAVYQVAYQHLADDIDGKTLQSETVAGTTIQFYLADDGHKICPASEESNVSAIYNATGVAWYYIIDTVNTRFKLPRTQFAFTGIRNGVGGFVEAGLPNITGEISDGRGGWRANNITTNGCITATSANGGNTGTGYGISVLKIDASLSSSVYGNSNTVQPKATEMYLYFYVGNFTQTALENTAGVTTETLNGKADLDLSNAVLNSTFAQLLLNAGIDVIVEKQVPTAENNYTWYRKYRSGWVEQGQKITDGTSNITLPIAMANDFYTITTAQNGAQSGNVRRAAVSSQTTTGFYIENSNSAMRPIFWQVSGMAA